MDKIKLKTVEKEYVENFMKYMDVKVNKDWVVNAAILNVIFIGVGIYLSEKSLQLIIAGLTFSLAFILSVMYFLKKVDHSDKNMSLYYGIYLCSFSTEFSFLSYQLLKKVYVELPIMIVVILIACDILAVIFSYKWCVRKICRNKYNKKANMIVFATAGSMGVALAKALQMDEIGLIGMLLSFLGIGMACQTPFIIKYYCYCLLEKNK